MRRFDTHVHVWGPRGDGHLIRIRERVEALNADFGFERLRPLLGPAGVERLVLVAAAQDESETEDLLMLARHHPDLVAGVIGWLDPFDTNFDAKVGRLAADPLWLGLRLPIVLVDASDYVTRPGLDRALDRLAAADALTQVLISPAQIAPVAAVLERHRTLRVVIDHAANPDVSRPPSQEWLEGTERLAHLPAVACKVSAFWLPGNPLPTDEMIAPFLTAVIAAFGPTRVVVSGNWPVSAPGIAYAEVFGRLEQLSGLAGPALDGLSYANAEQIYRRHPSEDRP